MKQKGDYYKITAVKYYLDNNDTMDNTCKIFNCKKPSLHRWIQIYKTRKTLQRKPRKSISYKVKKEQLKTALNMIDQNKQPTMDELLFDMKQKYKDFNITRQHLGRIIRTNKLERPSYLCRETSNQALKPSCYNQTLLQV